MIKYLLYSLLFLPFYIHSQEADSALSIQTGAEQTALYFPMLEDKNIVVAGNHTSMINHTHLVDSLVTTGFHVIKVFSPEHGFRGSAEAGKTVQSGIDSLSGIPVISLYGPHKKPTRNDLSEADLVLFDIQDVGVRVYTYISTLTYIMEACAENHIPLVVLDRPNPHGHYVDGPILDTAYRSFVGMHAVPLVHGMTVGEYARMVNGEGWLNNGIQCDLEVVPVKNYDHHTSYQLPVPPSPNLPNMNAVYLYPSLVLFEGTMISIGRGTAHPFEVIGHPDFLIGSYVFTPESKPGAFNPKCKDQHCYGTGLLNYSTMAGIPDAIKLDWLLGYYDFFKERPGFFNAYFDKLAGSKLLRQQIQSGMSARKIRKSWQKDLLRFKKLRNKYMLYPD